jgi:protocatechuate 3,4-dioxygenase beta subunit
MMKKNLLLWLIAIVTFSLTGLQSCKYKTDYQINTNPNVYDNSKIVVASFYGQLLDEAGAPIENATVTTSGYTTQTDVNGLYFFNNINTPEHNTCIKASKIGFFNGFRSMMVKAGDKHEVKLTLMKKDNAQSYVSSAGGTISTGNGLSITFPASALKNKATGLPYNGQVYVYAKRIDPTTSLGRNTMPGDLRGVSVGQNENMLRSFGMLVAELYDASGNALQLAETQEATISLDIPSSSVSSAPASIALWYFDEVKGIWVEEGRAMLQGNKYVGTVKHFSFWNCDTPEAAIQLEMTLIDQNNNPLSGYTVKLTNTANLDQRYGTTNASGWVGGLVYSNATLTMEVFSNINVCGASTPMYTQTVTTGAINQNLGTIIVNVASPATATISGTIVDCANNPISNASLLVQPLGLVIVPNAAGQFSYTIPCTPTGVLTYYAYDLTNNVYGFTTGTVVSGNNIIGNQAACGNVTPYLNITLTNTVTLVSATKNFLSPVDNVSAMVDSAMTNAYSTITASGSTGFVYIQANDSTVGSHLVIGSSLYGIGTFTDTQFSVVSGSVNYTSFPLFPGDVIGTFSLNLTGNPSGNTYTATGNFRAPRQN